MSTKLRPSTIEALTAEITPALQLLAAGRRGEAVHAMREAARRHDADADALLFLSRTIRQHLGEQQWALDLARRAAELRPDAEFAHRCVGLSLEDLGQWAAAEEAFLLGARCPDASSADVAACLSSAARVAQASAYHLIRAGGARSDETDALFRRAREHYQAAQTAQTRGTDDCNCEHAVSAAGCAIDMNDYGTAIRELDGLHAGVEALTAHHATRCAWLTQTARALLGAGRAEQALLFAEDAVGLFGSPEADPSPEERPDFAHEIRAQVLLALGQPEKAAQDWSHRAERVRDVGEKWMCLYRAASAYRAAGDRARALALLSSVLRDADAKGLGSSMTAVVELRREILSGG